MVIDQNGDGGDFNDYDDHRGDGAENDYEGI